MVNVDVVQDIIKIIGLRRDNAMNGTLKDLAKTRFCSNTTEKRVRTSVVIQVMSVTKRDFFQEAQNVSAMKRKVSSFGTKRGNVIAFTLRVLVPITLGSSPLMT